MATTLLAHWSDAIRDRIGSKLAILTAGTREELSADGPLGRTQESESEQSRRRLRKWQ